MPGAIIILHMCTIYENHLMFGSLDFECDWQIFFHFGPHFDLLTTQKNQNFEKIKKMPGDVIILHMCTINDNHM